MAYVPPHKRHSSTSQRAPTSYPPISSLHSLSISSSPRGRQQQRTPTPSKITNAVARWSPLPPFYDDAASVRLEPFPCDPVERQTGGKPLVLALSSPSSGSTDAAAAATAIAERFLPDLQDAAKRARAATHDVPREEEATVGLMARVGKVLFQPFCSDGSPVSLEAVRNLAKAGAQGSKSEVRKLFHTNLPSGFFEEMERSPVKRMGLDFGSSKEFYYVKVFDKQRVYSKINCKCTVQEDGKLAIKKVESEQIRHLVEDVSCLFKDLDLRLTYHANRILKKIDPEVENAIKSLVSSAIAVPNAKGGLRWPLGNKSIGERFSIVGVWRTNYKSFRNKSLKMYLRHTGRFCQRSNTGEASNEVSFKLADISKRLQDDNQDVDALKEMLESAVRTIWDYAMSNHEYDYPV